jgi:hypothetical protein
MSSADHTWTSTYRGTKHHAAKLNPQKVRRIRARFAKGKTTVAQLARDYDVTGPTITAVVTGRTWRHVQ